MDDSSWSDRIVGERMAVDREFSSRVAGSRFSSQEWSLIMTATEFEIEHPDDPERARLVANTDQVEGILPELENIQSQMGAMGAPGGGDRGGDGGVLTSLKQALGFGGGSGDDHEEERRAAEALTGEYAERLQERLESNGRWEEVRTAAAADGTS